MELKNENLCLLPCFTCRLLPLLGVCAPWLCHAFLPAALCFCLRRWASISWRKKSIPSWLWEASFMAFDCMHILYCSGGSSSSQCFSCHRWKRPREGARTTSRLLCRYFLYRCTSSPPQPLISTSKPPVRRKDTGDTDRPAEIKERHTSRVFWDAERIHVTQWQKGIMGILLALIKEKTESKKQRMTHGW